MVRTATTRPTLTPPNFFPGPRTNPTEGRTKKEAATRFNEWWQGPNNSELAILSDGSEQRIEGDRIVTYGFAIYRAQTKIEQGSSSLDPTSHVFDAEAVGALHALQYAIRSGLRFSRAWMCIDNTSVIWCLRGNAPLSSQWAFLACHDAMETYSIQVRWSPGHEGIIGNEEADSLAEAEARNPSPPYGMARHPTTSGIRSVAKTLLNQARQGWWDVRKTKLFGRYNQWKFPYSTSTSPPELELSRPTLAKLLAIRTKLGDFAWYHKKINHPDAQSYDHADDQSRQSTSLCAAKLRS
ncbi:hypothetical protein J1614_003864 [Plenodomus biglobosus]|nr:hypothetical protein J1614_003864 [Plenodomus biglobosus]